MTFTCKNKKCPSKGKPQDKIGVLSECLQTLSLKTDAWEDLEVGTALYGYCLECSEKLPFKTLDKIIQNAGGV